MFCLECGQPIAEVKQEVKNGIGVVVMTYKSYVHTTAKTHPWLDDHPAIYQKASWER